MNWKLTLAYLAISLVHAFRRARKLRRKPSLRKDADLSAVEREIKQFYDSYADDLRSNSAARRSPTVTTAGILQPGNGRKELVTFEANKSHYLKDWTGPKSFEWRDLSFEILSPTAASVVGLGDWTGSIGSKDRHRVLLRF
jgi:hypothetical protein